MLESSAQSLEGSCHKIVIMTSRCDEKFEFFPCLKLSLIQGNRKMRARLSRSHSSEGLGSLLFHVPEKLFFLQVLVFIAYTISLSVKLVQHDCSHSSPF